MVNNLTSQQLREAARKAIACRRTNDDLPSIPVQSGYTTYFGLSKREHMALTLMAALLSAGATGPTESIARSAIGGADALLKELAGKSDGTDD